MPISTPNPIGKCLREARRAAGYTSAGQAAAKVCRSPETVGRQERGDIPLTAEDAMYYAEAYGRPDLMLRYCDECPIHKAVYGDVRIRDRDLPWNAMRIATRLRKSAYYAEQLEAILDDGVVDAQELPDLMAIFDFLHEVGEAGREMLAASMSLGIVKGMKKAAPEATGSTERAKTNHCKTDQIAHVYCTTTCVGLSK